MKFLIVNDPQNDFIIGSYGSDMAREVVPNIVAKINDARMQGDMVFVTVDTHHSDYPETQEGKRYPAVHCIEQSNGWKIQSDILQAVSFLKRKNVCSVIKETFGAARLMPYLWQAASVHGMPSEIELIGLHTSTSVLATAVLVQSEFARVPVVVQASCCADVDKVYHDAALEAMNRLGIIVRTDP